jgi:hypothetical protein
MSIQATRKKLFSCHFGEDDFFIEDIRLNAVHQIPETYSPNCELDFYLDNGDDIFLLRLENSPKNELIYITSGELEHPVRQLTYLIVRKTLQYKITKELSLALRKIKKIGFPQDKQSQSIYAIDDWE